MSCFIDVNRASPKRQKFRLIFGRCSSKTSAETLTVQTVGFSQYIQEISEIVTLIRSRWLPSPFFPVHYSRVIPPFDAVVILDLDSVIL